MKYLEIFSVSCVFDLPQELRFCAANSLPVSADVTLVGVENQVLYFNLSAVFYDFDINPPFAPGTTLPVCAGGQSVSFAFLTLPDPSVGVLSALQSSGQWGPVQIGQVYGANQSFSFLGAPSVFSTGSNAAAQLQFQVPVLPRHEAPVFILVLTCDHEKY